MYCEKDMYCVNYMLCGKRHVLYNLTVLWQMTCVAVKEIFRRRRVRT